MTPTERLPNGAARRARHPRLPNGLSGRRWPTERRRPVPGWSWWSRLRPTVQSPREGGGDLVDGARGVEGRVELEPDGGPLTRGGQPERYQDERGLNRSQCEPGSRFGPRVRRWLQASSDRCRGDEATCFCVADGICGGLESEPSTCCPCPQRGPCEPAPPAERRPQRPPGLTRDRLPARADERDSLIHLLMSASRRVAATSLEVGSRESASDK